MTQGELQGRRILVVEDEYLIADDMREALSAAGAEVIGPAPSIGEATALIDREEAIDAALLDVNLQGEMVFALADALAVRGIPFAFATGYDRWSLPDRFKNAPRLEKPIRAREVAAALKPLIAPRRRGLTQPRQTVSPPAPRNDCAGTAESPGRLLPTGAPVTNLTRS